jgi:hypothetical protein
LTDLQDLRFPSIQLSLSTPLEVDVLLGEVQLAEQDLVLLFERDFVGLIANLQGKLPVFELEKFDQEFLITEDFALGHLADELGDSESVNGSIDLRNPQEEADQQNFLVVEEVLGDIAVDIKNATIELILRFSLGGGPDGSGNFIEVGVEAFLEFAVASQYKFLIEVVAIDVDGGALVDLASHENNAVLEPHGEVDIVIVEDLENALGYDVVGGIHVYVRD